VVSLRALLLGALLLAACDRERTVLVDGVPEDFDVVVRVDGVEVPSERRRGRVRARITAPPDATVSLSASGPCGQIALPIRRVESAHENEVYELDGTVAVRRVLVDTRNATGRVLTLGALAVDVPPGAQRAVTLAAVSCDEGRVVRVDGETIGELPPSASAEVLVDVDGSHCYRVTAEELVPAILANLPGEESPPLVTHLTRARVHDLSPLHVDFAFSEIPDHVDPSAIHRFDDGRVFTSLVAEDCAP
jgi:hypothetical protein